MTVDEEVAARTYQYQHGDRPLDGYTIQRAAGRGGFGEVYYALSDSGREVALKLVLTYEKIELRGISQCMNIKSPQLVTIFDVKHGNDGRPWVIMEFVSGPSLRELLDAAPSGLGAAKSAFFLREIGKGLTYLHDCGIVHRDLKPGNIFYENGCVKIGDYGLSKAMNMSQHSGQTVAVGTLHYMAPEIGEGRYDRTIDIYALGALLFEMITGQVPFYGSSVAEVLMKHLRSDVCLDGIEEPFQSVIRKAMAKNPAERYQSVQEMVEAVFGSEQVRNSVSQFSPASLTQVAGRAARGIGGADGAFNEPGDGGVQPQPWDRATARVKAKLQRAQQRLERAGDRMNRKFGGNWNPVREPTGPTRPDQMTAVARIFLAILATAFAAIVGGISASGRNGGEDTVFVISVIFGSILGVKLARKIIGSSLSGESKWVQRFALGMPAALGVALLSFPCWPDYHMRATLQACIWAVLLLDWDLRISPNRKERLCVGQLFSAGICALIFAGIFDQDPLLAISAVVGASAAVSLLSAWGPAAPQATRPAGPTPAPPTPGMAPVFQMHFGASRRATPASPSPIPEPPIPPAPGAASQPPPRRRSPSKGIIVMLVALVLWVSCFIAINESNKRVAMALLSAAVFVTARILMKNRGGILTNSNTSMAGEMMSAGASLGGFASSVARGIIGVIGSTLLFASILLALSVSINVPGLLDSGVVDPHIPQNLANMMGTPHWPRLMTECATAAGAVISMSSIVFLLVARRPGGGGHMIRAVLGVLVLLGGAIALGQAMPNLGYMTPAATPADTVDHYFQQVQFPGVIRASSVFLVGAVLLGWPPRRHPRPALIPPAAPAKQEAAK